MLAQAPITVQLTQEQFNIFVKAMAEAKASDIRIRDWTGETMEEIEARYQVPSDDILEDMADYYFQQQTSIPMF
jgi:hypothetical protein